MAEQTKNGSNAQMDEVTQIVRAMRADRVPRSKISSTLNGVSVDSLLVIENSGAHRTKPETQAKLTSWLASYPQQERERWLAASSRGAQGKTSGSGTSSAKKAGAKSPNASSAKKATTSASSGGAKRATGTTGAKSASSGAGSSTGRAPQGSKAASSSRPAGGAGKTTAKGGRGPGAGKPAWSARTKTSGGAGAGAGRQMVSARQAAKKSTGAGRKRTASAKGGASSGGGQVTILRENGQPIRLQAGQEYHMKGNASFFQMNEVR